MKKFLSILLSTLMIFTCMTTNVFAGSPGYTITSESTQNGSFTVKSPVGDIVDRAPENGEITITPTANNGFEVDKVEWKKASAPSYTTITNDSGYKFTMPAEAVSVKVSFKASGATVKFNANTGSGTMSDVTNVSGDYTLPSCTFTAPSGKVFDGWATSVSGTKISTSTYNVSEDVTFYALWKDPSTTISDEVATKIKNGTIHTLYDVGEANLTADDIVTVNGVDCYVLSVNTASNTAQLITKNIYDVRFDNGGHDSSTPNLGTESGYTDKTYNYEYSTLKTYMDNFYTNKLGSDSRIIDHEVTSYTKDSYLDDLSAYSTSTITQKVYALDAVEAKTNASKFGSSSWSDYNAYRDSAYSDNCYAFWVSVGCIDADGKALLFCVHYGGGFECLEFNDDNMCGARPAFTISVSPSKTTYSDDITVSWKTNYSPKVGDTIATVKNNLVFSDSGDDGKLNYNYFILDSEMQPINDDSTQLNEGTYYFNGFANLKNNTQYVLNATQDPNNSYAKYYFGNVSILGQTIISCKVGDYNSGNLNSVEHNNDDMLALYGASPVSFTASPSTVTVPYINANGDSATQECVPVTSDMTSFGKQGQTTWYVVSEDTTISSVSPYNVDVNGNVNLIIVDNKKLTINGRSRVKNNSEFNVFGQSSGNGALFFDGSNSTALVVNGTMNIIGGNLSLSSKNFESIYCGGVINVKGGSVVAKSGFKAVNFNTINTEGTINIGESMVVYGSTNIDGTNASIINISTRYDYADYKYIKVTNSPSSTLKHDINSNDFEVTSSGNGYKEFTKGNVSASTIHIANLTLSNVNTTSDTLHPGITVMNGDTKLTEGTDYTVTVGSIKVNLTKAYLDSLDVGTHTLNVYISKDGMASSANKQHEFTVNVKINTAPSTGGGSGDTGSSGGSNTTYKAPNTGVGISDNNPTAKALGLMSLLTLAGVVINKKED